MSSSKKGLLLVIISGFVFGVMPSAISYCYEQGATTIMMVFFRYAMLASVLFIRRRSVKGLLTDFRRHAVPLLLLGICGAATPLLLFSSYRYLPTGISTTIHYLYPMLVAILCVTVFHDQISRTKLLCFLLCLGGIGLMLDLTGGSLNRTGIILAAVSSVTWACYIVFLGKFDFGVLQSTDIMLYVALISQCMFLVYGLATGGFVLNLGLKSWGAIILTDLVIAIFGSLFFSIGARQTDAQAAAIASTLEPIVSILIGTAFLHETVNFRTAAGTVMILTAVILLAVSENNASNKK